MQVIREFREDLVTRLRALSILVTVLMVVIAGAFWFVQVVQGGYYRDLAENNRLRKLPIRAPRGLIYDHRGRSLVENIPSYNLMLDRSRAADVQASLGFAAGVLEVPVEELAAQLEKHRDIPAFQPVVLAERLTLSQVARFGVVSLEHPEFEIDVEHLRLYRHGPQTGHIVGYLGEVSKQDVERRPEVYSPGDLIGKRGIEESYDLHLRGHEGQRVVVVDSRGRVLEEYGREPAESGRPLTLSLDLDLQQEAERQLRERVGAVVAMDPRTGEIRAMYSSPAYDPNLFARGLTKDELAELLKAPHNPLLNRVIQTAYHPGSVFKIVNAVAGLSEGIISPRDRVYCSGAAVIYGRPFRCWKRGGHGSVDLKAAIKGSCNVYFYHLGQRVGIENLARYARRMGLGQLTGIELGGEKRGLVPDPQWKRETLGVQWFPGETISIAIGQGQLETTPLQIARLMAVVANGERLVEPRLTAPSGDEQTDEPLEIDPKVLEPVRAGLVAVVNEPGGTARYSGHVPGLNMAGKTGTAQVVGQSKFLENKHLPFEQRDHAWFASYAPAEAPELVVVVFVEHGGFGSSAAAPVAKALYEIHFRSRLGHLEPV